MSRLRAHAPLLLVAAGVLLRAVHLLTWDVPKGFDFTEHWKYILYLLSMHRVPLAPDRLPFWVYRRGLGIGDGSFRASYHPPAFFWLAHFLVPGALHPIARFRSAALVVLARRVAWISVVAGGVRLLLLERFLARAFPGEETLLGRSLAVGLAAVLSCAVRMDQTVSPEALEATLIVAALYLLLESVRGERAARQLAFAGAAGLLAGTAMLSKYTGLVAVGTMGCTYAGQVLFEPQRWRRAVVSLVLGLSLAASVCGWYYARNARVLGKAFPDSYDYSLAYEKARVRATHRPLEWYLPFEPRVFWNPTWSRFWNQHPNYWSQMYATAWGDYYSTRFIAHDLGDHDVLVNGRPISGIGYASMEVVLWLAILPTLAMLMGILVWVRAAWPRRETEWRVAVPALACAFGALAVAFANTVLNALESDGPTKSEYALAATPILCAVAGFALAAAWRRWPRLRALLVLDLGALALVLCLQTLVL